MQLDTKGKPIEAVEEEFGEHVLIVEPAERPSQPAR
jgi:hypothetical protein